MTQDYVPTTEEIKFPATRLGRWTSEAFDRWLNSIKAEAWDEGFEAATEVAQNGWMPELINAYNPYRDVDS